MIKAARCGSGSLPPSSLRSSGCCGVVITPKPTWLAAKFRVSQPKRGCKSAAITQRRMRSRRSGAMYLFFAHELRLTPIPLAEGVLGRR
eukprot:6207207-Pleurochrysis_carterae.AAC.1